MSRPGGYIGYEFGDDDVYVQHIIEEKKAGAEQSKMLGKIIDSKKITR